MNNKKDSTKRIYLDHAAATPLSGEVLETMMPFLVGEYGNPSSIHSEGVRARKAIEEARSNIARTLSVKPDGVIFTGNGTESNNLAVLGHVKFLHSQGLAYEEMEIVTTKIEHPSISNLVPALEDLGVTVRFVEVDEEGLVSVQALNSVLSTKTILVSFAYANSEVGVIQPVSRLSRAVKKFAKENNSSIKIHLDASQAPLWLSCALGQLGVDMMTLDSGKCNGPKGVGLLVMSRAIGLLPIMQGGGQEKGIRSGTENVVGIVGMSRSLELAQTGHKERAEKVAEIRDWAIELLKEKIPTVQINGAMGEKRLANNINLSIPDLDTEYAVIYLDMKGVSASTKSACAGAGGGESAVVKTMTGDATRARSTIRFSLGENTTKEDMEQAVDILVGFCEKMRGRYLIKTL